MASAQEIRFGAALPFKPSLDQPLLNKSLDHIPRYLFRLYSPNSNGNTTEDVVDSPAVIKGRWIGNIDLLMLPRALAADMLLKHTDWSRDPYDDNLMSWTSSLFFALQHGLRRHPTYDGSDYSDLRICIVDTRMFPRGTFIKDLNLLKVFADEDSIRSFLRLRHSSYYFGEYFSQGHLNISQRSAHVSLQTLMSLGLYDVEPRFRDKQKLLAKRVVELRGPFKQSLTCPATKGLTRKAIAMGQSFGDEFALPVALMLLSLCPRPRNDCAILDGFGATFTGRSPSYSFSMPTRRLHLVDEEISSLSWNTLQIDGERLPEVQQFANLLRDLRQHPTPQGSALNPLLVDDVSWASHGSNAIPTTSTAGPVPRNAALTIDLTGLEDVVSSMSRMSGKPIVHP